ncbi:MAG: hypothetical protein GX572_03565 [Clostridia bacterium]|nr:hypothetical protein [Clostridia bacterium]
MPAGILYRLYRHQGVELHLDRRIADTDQVQIRVNAYLQRGRHTFRVLLLGLKETIWPSGAE